MVRLYPALWDHEIDFRVITVLGFYTPVTLRVFSSAEPDAHYQLGSQLYIALMKNYRSTTNFPKTNNLMVKRSNLIKNHKIHKYYSLQFFALFSLFLRNWKLKDNSS